MMLLPFLLSTALIAAADGNETTLLIDAGRILHRVSPLLSGACIEDVNHEIYGGLYSQMIFGESFQEPPLNSEFAGFSVYGGRWSAADGEVRVEPGGGPKLVADGPPVGDAVVRVDVRFPAAQGGSAGLILKVDHPEKGADAFTGYEVSLDTAGRVSLGRHRRNWEPITTAPCEIPVDKWVAVDVQMKGSAITIRVDGRTVMVHDDTQHPLPAGLIGLRTWQRPVRFRNLRVIDGKGERDLPVRTKTGDAMSSGLSGMWGPVRRGSARGASAIETREPFTGRQSQTMTFLEGEGEIGLDNRGLNRWGMNFVAGKPFEGYVWARASQPTELFLALEGDEGSMPLAVTSVKVQGGTWTRYEFALTPSANQPSGRFVASLKSPGSVSLGHVFLQPGEWGRYKDLPVRKDVVDGLIDQGVTILRYGGCMANHAEYRWKNMIGPSARRPPTAGWWYAYSSNGWGVFDFLNLCEAAGIVGIPDVNASETPQDMVDFVEYVNGPADSPWGRKRVADGHPAPYNLKYLEIGNEEAVNEAYWHKFRATAEAVWAKDPAITLIVGDFAYGKVIVDPFAFEGGAAANSLAAHKKILELARSHGREVWFDIHVNTNQPPEPEGLLSERSYIDQLGKLAPGANFKVVIFEYNAGNHAMKRALSNALATNEAERLGDVLPIVCSANALQPDRQNDNDWDQGLLFLTPSRVWLQPPGYVTRMTSRRYQPLLVHSETKGHAEKLSVNVKRSVDGKTLVLQVVNWEEQPRPTRIDVQGFEPSKPMASVEELNGPLDAVNTAAEPLRVVAKSSEWRHAMAQGKANFTFAPRSLTMIQLD